MITDDAKLICRQRHRTAISVPNQDLAKYHDLVILSFRPSRMTFRVALDLRTPLDEKALDASEKLTCDRTNVRTL